MSVTHSGYEVRVQMTYQRQIAPGLFTPETIDERFLAKVEGEFSPSALRPLTDAEAVSGEQVFFATENVPDEDIREAYFVAEETGLPPPSTPFPFHRLTFYNQGRDVASGRHVLRWELEWTVPPAERPATIAADPIPIRMILDYDRPAERRIAF